MWGPHLTYTGPVTPFIAVPTTAGTGSEAAKNAVLSMQGADGFKKSFRDEKLVAEYAVVDPDLLVSCPSEVISANGMDAFTQLLESYVSSRATPLTDLLAWGGMNMARDGLLALYADSGNADTRSRMAYAALISGITLAQVGLGQYMIWRNHWVRFSHPAWCGVRDPELLPRKSISTPCRRVNLAIPHWRNMHWWVACSANSKIWHRAKHMLR